MRTTISLTTALLTATVCLPALGQTQPETRYPITPRLVARALSYSGMETADEQVSLGAPMLATEPFPALDILSVEPPSSVPVAGAAEVRTTIKLACHVPTSCLPFIAIVVGANAFPARDAVNRSVAGAKTNPAFTMRAGTHAILVMDDQVTHIQVAVITLENGAPGKWIRVASPDRKQFYRAEVVSANLLRGDF